VLKLLNYFTETYLDPDICLFNRNMWNHFNTDGARTINHLEGWHAALNKAIGRTKPNIFILIKELKNQQTNFELDLIAQKNCIRPQNMKTKYRKLKERLSFAKERLQNGAICILEYLDDIMFHFHLENRRT
ncbi:MULE domain-containing protein, partial [Aphis craccivora]